MRVKEDQGSEQTGEYDITCVYRTGDATQASSNRLIAHFHLHGSPRKKKQKRLIIASISKGTMAGIFFSLLIGFLEDLVSDMN